MSSNTGTLTLAEAGRYLQMSIAQMRHDGLDRDFGTPITKASIEHALVPHRTFEQEEGLVYFVEAPSERLIKIGKTRDIRQRMATLTAASPAPLRLLGVVLHQYGRYELHLHAHFAHLRAHSEWFRVAPELRRFIRRMTGFYGPAERPVIAPWNRRQ